ncbi:hypothetical protein L5515_002667 [Caenorhabditis briggsae]|uniref:F-box domain-containing protein n=1 Tax=Caenorhabditis briggsae TaxID=6238 RepID=A0AAE9J4K4_CAEBR|nr:hypothetical protein L5515_002667 [Caenorhabditis briggsae]
MPINLFKLPSVVFREIFQEWTPLEFYSLAKCSKRLLSLVKSIKTENWRIISIEPESITLSCGVYGDYTFQISENPDVPRLLEVHPRIRMLRHPEEGVSDLLADCSELFGITVIDKLDAKNFIFFDHFLKLSKLIVDRKLEVKRLFFEDLNVYIRNVAGVIPFLNVMKITENLFYSHYLENGFQPNFARFPKTIFIKGSSWFNIEQLLDCTSIRIKLEDSMLTNEDMDRLLRKWKRNEMPNLQWIKVCSQKIHPRDAPILDMRLPIEVHFNPTDHSVIFDDNSRVWLSGGIEITADDGTIGYLKCSGHELEFIVPKPSKKFACPVLIRKRNS